MKIISIDPSVRSTGVYIECKSNSRNLWTTSTFKTEKDETHFDMVNRIKRKLEYFKDKHGIKLILIEGYSNNSIGRSSLTLAELGGALRYVIKEIEMEYLEIAPLLWKNIIWGSNWHLHAKRNTEQKKEYIEAAHQITKKNFTNVDEVDAGLIAEAFYRGVMYKGVTGKCKKIKEMLYGKGISSEDFI